MCISISTNLSFFNYIFKGNIDGLKSIDYIRNLSKLRIEDTNGISLLEGEFVFHNYSNDEKKFFVRLVKSDKQKHINPLCDYLVEAINFEDSVIVVPPRTEISVRLKKETSSNSIYPMYKGEFTGIDLCIYNNDDQVNFIEHQY